MIASGKKVIASVAPSFIAEFPLMDFAAMKDALLKLGLSLIHIYTGGPNMKKSVSLLLAGAMFAGLLAGCSSSSTSGGTSAVASGSTAPSSVVSGEAGSKSIEKLSIAFVPSREPEEIITATEPLKEMLTAELAGLGYDVGEVEITVGTSYAAVGCLLYTSYRRIAGAWH